MTLYDWITNDRGGGPNSWMGALLNAGYNEEYGAETTGQSSLNLIYLLGFNASPGNFSIYGKSDERYHIAGGNLNLPPAIAHPPPRGGRHPGYRHTTLPTNHHGSITVCVHHGETITPDPVNPWPCA